MKRVLLIGSLLLLFLGAIGCDQAPYVTGVQGTIIARDWILIDAPRGEFWGKIVLLTHDGDQVVLNLDLHTYLKLEDYSCLSIRFKRNGKIKDYAYGRNPEEQIW